MSRKVSGVMAGWLAAVSVAFAQSGQPAGSTPAGKNKTLSPYYPTASTVDWSGEDEAIPELLPPPPAAKNAPPAAPSPIRQAGGIQPPPMPIAAAPPAPATPPPPMATSVVPAAPSPSSRPAPPAAKSTLPPMLNSAVGPACTSGTCGQAWTNHGPCGPAGRVWADAELLLWWTRGMEVPALVTSSPSGTPRNLAGVIGVPTTRILFGNEQVNDELDPGFRVRAGMWLDDCQLCGIEGSYFFVGPQTTDQTFTCLDAPILARPFFDVNPGVPNPLNAQIANFAPNSQLVCFPGIVTGTVNVNVQTDFYGFDANFRRNLLCECDHRVDLLVGYRYFNLTDKLGVTENLQVTTAANPAIPLGTTFLVHDQFNTTNDFNGGQVGLAGERRSGRWYVSGRTLVGLGNTHSEVNISGYTRAMVPGGAPMFNAGGLLTQPTNMGTFPSDQTSWIYESQAILGYQVTDGIRAFVSYSYLYWTNVARAGDQIDLVVNSSQIPPGSLVGPARPVFARRDTDFWAQGISFGLEMRY